ncbi:MAG: hypothetical protein EZS28_005748 [Streblomastix strix]|uniref:Right handed beta helix domain-containing protein n=1 Tax=Streblomastix strix TaxID=222440 RepID=A0A5J4WVA5_9EUKA|nr:MAG: hypothetical protein EZS28_005748 [Streblomastix strix]
MGIDIITDDEQYYKQILEGSLSILQNSVYYDLFYGYFSLEQDTNPGFKLIYVKFPREEEFDGSINEVLGDGIITTELQVNLIGLKHLEKVSIDQEKGYKRGYISIKGDGEQNQQRVILGGGAEDEGEGQFVITISEGTIGDILIWNIEMQKWLGGFIKADGGKSISLRDCLFYGGGTVIHNTIGRLEATKCEFMGKGAFVDIDSFIITSQGYIDISESIFHHGSFLGQEKGCIVCNEQSTYCLIWSSYFVDNKLGSESAAVLITTQTCKQLSIKGTADLYGEFSEFSDAIFTQNGNTVLLEAVGNVITVEQYDGGINHYADNQVKFENCFFTNNKGFGFGGTIALNIKSKCNFTNIDIIDYISASTLCFDFYFANIIKINISNNSFEKCISHEVEERGILIHIDEEQFKANSLVIIENNIFRENVGQKTGGIFFQLMSRAFYYSFANNSFYKNLIVGESFSELGQGKGAEDAYIQWYYFPDGWTADNIKQKITDIFQGSTTYQYSQTVYYEVLKRIIDQDYDEMILYGYIDLLNNEENQSEQELDQKDSSESDQNPSSGKGVGIGIIIAIAIGALIVVAAIIVIIIVIIVCLKKKSQGSDSQSTNSVEMNANQW